MPTLTWTRERDSEHNGRPTYEYRATGKDGVRYHIVWAITAGFGYTAYDAGGDQVHKGVSIQWCRSLKACQERCEIIEAGRVAPVKLVPNWAGQFNDFDDWVRSARRKLADMTCETSGSTMPVPAMCVDTKGRRCYQGGDFARARDEGCFPVRYFWDCKPE